MFVWNWVPEFIAPVLTGISIICLFNREANSFTRLFGNESINKGGVAFFTNVFGGSLNNEGLGLFSISLNWNQITSGSLNLPWATQINVLIGALGCIILMTMFYVNNVWNALNFPFMSQQLFLINGSEFDQLMILDKNFRLDPVKYEAYGQPWCKIIFLFQIYVFAI